MERRVLLTVYPVTDTGDGTDPGTLRWAITQVNKGTGGDTIAFAIAGTGAKTIRLNSELPTIAVPVTIDGTTQPNYQGAPLIQLDGSGAGATADGLKVMAGSSTIVGLSIVGFQGDAIRIAGAGGNTVAGNYIGVGLDGATVSSNRGQGLVINSANNTIGGLLANQGNVISGNGGYGIVLDGAMSNLVQGNLIGVDASGTLKRGNGASGILVRNSSNNVIGGLSAVAGNVISSNGAHGIETFGATDGLLVQGNAIGTDRSRSLNLGNRVDGVHLFSSNNTIGGQSPGAGNTIAYNGMADQGVGAGVSLILNVVNNAVLSNSIFANVGLGIDLGGSGNRSQQPPRIDAASTNAVSTSVSGLVSGRPSAAYLLQFFANTKGDPLGFGEGEIVLGTLHVQTDAAGNAVYSGSFPVGVAPGALISATATDSSGNTSQFARNVTLMGTADLGIALTSSPDAAAVGEAITFTVVVTNYGPTVASWVSATTMLPVGVTVVSATTEDGRTGVPGPNSITFNTGGLGVGESFTATIVVRTSVATGSFATALASVQGLDSDPNPGNNTANTSVALSPVVDLAVDVKAPTSPVVAGGTATYVITLSNLGPSSATGLTLTNLLPAHVGLISATATRGVSSIRDNVLTTEIPALDAGGAPVVLTILVALDPAATDPSITLTSFAVANELDSNTENNTETATTSVARSADLQVAVQAAPTPVLKGQPLTYTVTLINLGPSTATAISLVDVLPEGATFVSARDELGGTPSFANGVVTRTLASLAPGGVVVLTVVVTAPGSTVSALTNVVSVTSDVDDPVPLNDSATVTTLLNPAADLSVTITADASSVGVGRNLSYTITVTNRGPSPATGVTLADLLPAFGKIHSIRSSQGEVTEAGGRVTGLIGTLAADATATLSIVIEATTESGLSLVNSATVSSDVIDPLDANNQASLSTTVTPRTDLTVSITPLAGPLAVSRQVTYQVTVTNQGPSIATGVQLTDLLPAGSVFVSASDGRGASYSPVDGQLTVPVGELGPGDSTTLNIVVFVAVPGPFVTLATVNGNEVDDDPSNNTATVATTVVPAVDLSLNVVSGQSVVTTGALLTYLLTVTNQGPSLATGVTLHKTLPWGASVLSIFTSQGTTTLGDGELIAQLGDLAVGATAALWIVVMPTLAGPAISQDTVSAQEIDLNPADNSTFALSTVVEPPGSLGFATGSMIVNEDAGTATIVVSRVGGRQGRVTVGYDTILSGTAVPGVDFIPVSGVLTFESGESVKTFTVPVLANPHSQQDRTVSLVLRDPQGGAELGAQVATTLTIHDLDPDFAGPRVEEVRLFGPTTSITSLRLFVNEALDPATALSPAGYQLVDVGPDGWFGTADDQRVPLRPPAYDPLTQSVVLQPDTPLSANRFYYVQVSGLRDLAGNLLESGAGALAPHQFGSYLIRGTNLRYFDSRQTLVTIGMSGGGLLDLTRYANGEGNRLQVLNPTLGRSVLTGRVRGGTNSTSFSSIIGLGAFGGVRVKMSTPSFLVDHLPFNRRFVSPPAVDGVDEPVRINGRPTGPKLRLRRSRR